VAARGVVTEPHKLLPRSLIVSSLKLIVWTIELWLDSLFNRGKNFNIKIFDRYFYDVLVDPLRYRYGGRLGFARLLAKIVPRPDLIIFLDAPVHVVISRKQEVPPKESARQLASYFELAKKFSNSVVLNSNVPLSSLTKSATAAVFDAMARGIN
jgi:thymidylate kinase